MSSDSRPNNLLHDTAAPPAEAWQVKWAQTIPRLEQISRRRSSAAQQPSSDISVMRSSQLDAVQLDNELAAMLREQFMKIFSFFQPGLISRFQPELSFLLHFLIFRFSVWENRPLPGMALMNLRFRNEAALKRTSSTIEEQRTGVEGPGLSQAQRSFYCLGAVLLPYAWSKLKTLAAIQQWGDTNHTSWRYKVWQNMKVVENGYHLASLVNLLSFLQSGRYRSVLERVLSARLVYAQPSAARAISYEYLNRQLVWSELSELLLSLLPLLSSDAVKRALTAWLPRLPPPAALTSMTAARAAAEAAFRRRKAQSQKNQAALSNKTPLNNRNHQGVDKGKEVNASEESIIDHQVVLPSCGLCGAGEPAMPYAAVPCDHVYCYYCLRSHVLADARFACLICGVKVDAMKPALTAEEQ